jgi:hypothetical protein
MFGPVVLAGSPLLGQTAAWEVDERVLITDFGIVTALARSPRTLFVATRGGLLAWDEAFGGWDLPLTVEDGYPVAPVTAAVHDHRDGTVWIAAAGDLLQLDPFARRFVNRVRIGRPLMELVPAEGANEDLFLREGGEWWRVDTFSRDVRRADPEAVRRAIDARYDLRTRREALQDPFFRDGIEAAARAWNGRRIGVTDVTPTRDASTWWLGTAGDFLLEYDHVSRQARGSSYGPVGSGMAAVAVGAEGVWFAPARPLEGRYGLARASPDLTEWNVWRADSSRTVPDNVRALLVTPRGVWAGGAAGLHWLGARAVEWREERQIDQIVSPIRTLSPATGSAGQGVWVGTDRGLYRILTPGAGPDVAVLPGESVRAVAETDAVVWIGTTRGLFGMPMPDSTGEWAGSVGRAAGPGALRGHVSSIAVAGDTVFAGIEAEVWWRRGQGGQWARLDAVGRTRGAVTCVAVGEGVVWVGSTAELTVWNTRSGAVARFAFGPDLPPDEMGATGVWWIAPVSAQQAWLALPAGALRVEMRF